MPANLVLKILTPLLSLALIGCDRREKDALSSQIEQLSEQVATLRTENALLEERVANQKSALKVLDERMRKTSLVQPIFEREIASHAQHIETCNLVCSQGSGEECSACSEGGQANLSAEEQKQLDSYFEPSLDHIVIGRWVGKSNLLFVGPEYAITAQYDTNADVSMYVSAVTFQTQDTATTLVYFGPNDRYPQKFRFLGGDSADVRFSPDRPAERWRKTDQPIDSLIRAYSPPE